MKRGTFFIVFFICACFVAPSIAAPAAFLVPRTDVGGPLRTCVSLAGYNDSTPVTLAGGNAACDSSNGGLDCAWYPSLAACASAGAPRSDAATLICGSENYYKRFGDYGYGNRDSWCCLALKALSGNNSVTRPSSLPDAVPFECKSSLSLGHVIDDTVATVCNKLSDGHPILVVKYDQGAKPLDKVQIDTGSCHSWRNFVKLGEDVELLLYRSNDGGTSYTAAAWVFARNPSIGTPNAGVADSTYWDAESFTPQRGRYCSADTGTKLDYVEGQTQGVYSYGHFQVKVTRNPDLDGAKQFLFDVEILIGQVTMPTNEVCTYVPVNVTY